MNKPLAIAKKPFRAMKVNNSKEKSFYTQGQQFAARGLFILWLLSSSSPEGALAAPERQPAMTLAITTSPQGPSSASKPSTPTPGGALQLLPDSPGFFGGGSIASSPALERALQQRMSQEATPDKGRELLRTFPGASPVEEHLPFQARGGESVRFHYQMGQWRAEVSSHLGAFSRRAVLPVVCSQGEDVASSLEVLSRYTSWQRQRQIHVLDRNVCPTLGEVVYVGELGLKGGGGGEASGSREPQGEVSDPAEQGDGEQAASSDAARLAKPAVSQTLSQLSSAQAEAQRLRKEIAALYSTFSEASEASALPMVYKLLQPIDTLLELEGFWSEDSLGKACAQDYLVKLRDSVKSRKLALDQARDQQLIQLLERSYSSSLKQLAYATASSQSVQLIRTLEKLAALSSDQGAMTQDLSHYTDAAILYQHILSICAKDQDTMNSQEAAALQNAAYQRLVQLQASMLAQAQRVDAAATTPEDAASLQKCIAEDRNELEAFRADVKPRATALINNLEATLSDQGSSEEAIKQAEEAYIQGSQALFGEIAQRMGELLAKLYQESEALLGSAPCKYAVMGLGSMALQQITPYSDLEFAILIEDAKNEAQEARWKEYFRKLTHLVHFRVINLGETVVPFGKYKLSLDHLGKRGLNFDLGGKIPLGRSDKPHLKKPYELIQPVSGMVHYLYNEEDKMEHMDKLLPYILESTCYVYGDSSLHERYVAEKCAFLLDSRDALGNPAYQKRALKKLVEGVVERDYSQPGVIKDGRRHQGDLADFKPKFGDEDAGRLYDVKQEIYRLPDRLLYRLAMYYGILPTSGWDAIDQLSQHGIIGVGDEAQQAAHHLHYAVSFATMLRLQTYLHHGQQFEKATMLSKTSQEAEVRQAVLAALTLPESSLQAGGSLFKYYYTAIPLYGEMKRFFEEPSQEGSFFQQAPFYDSSAETRAAIHQRMLQHKETKDSYEEALAIEEQRYGPNHPSVARTVHKLGIAWGALGDARQAVSFLERALAIYEQVYQETPNHPDIAGTLNNLGNAWRTLGDGRQAVSFYQRALAIYEQVYQEAPNHPDIASTLNNLGNAWRTLGDGRQAVSFYQRALAIYEQVYQETPNHPDIAGTLNNLGNAWRALGDARQAVSFLERTLAIKEQVYNTAPNHPVIARTLNNLGAIWCDALGDARKAVSYFERTLAIYEQVRALEPNHPNIALILNNLGNAWRALGDARQAVSFYERALAIKEQVYNTAPNHPVIAKTLNNLGAIWCDALGDARKAVSYFERTLAIYEQVHVSAPNHPVIAKTLNNLGNAWCNLGDVRKAVSYYERALAIQEQVYNTVPNHPVIASTLNNLGNAWRNLGDMRKAVSYYERALAIYEQIYQKTPNHPVIASTLDNLGDAWRNLGDVRKAVSYYERALAIYEQIYQKTPNHPVIASTLNNLGDAWRDLGDGRQAVSFYQRALAIYEQVYQETPNHPDIASTLNNLGDAWRDLGDGRQAVSFYQRALAIYEQIYQKTPNQPVIASTLNNLGAAWRDLGDGRQAVSFYQRALAIYEQVYNEVPNHPDIAHALNNLGLAWRDLGDVRKAVSFYERALAIKEQVYKEVPNHPDIASTLNNLGIAWRDLGQARQAVSFYERALAIFEQVYKEDPNHPDIARTLNNLGAAWRDLGKARKAVSFYERALAIKEQVYKEVPNHPDIARTLNNLGLAWRDLGDACKAVSFLERALAIFEQVYNTAPNHPAIALTLTGLGTAWRDLDGRQAVSFYERALAIYEQVYKEDPNHPDIAKTLNNLGIAWRDLGQARKAVSVYERALAIYEQVYKEALNHLSIARTLGNLGRAWHDLGDTRKAVSYLERALEISTQTCGKEHPLTQQIKHNLESLKHTSGCQITQFTQACLSGNKNVLGNISVDSLKKDLYDNERNPLICWMAHHGMTATLEQVLALGWNPNLPNANQVYPLHYGAMKNVAVTRLLLQAGAHPFVQTRKGNTPAMAARHMKNLQTLALLLPAQAMLSFADLGTFAASYQAYKERFTASDAGDEELLVALELALQLGDTALLQAIGTSQAEYCLFELVQKYPLAEATIQVCFRRLLASPIGCCIT